MDTVEILLLFVVGCSVVVFLVLDNLESSRKDGEACDDGKVSISVSGSGRKNTTGSSVESVIEIAGAEKPEISENTERAALLEEENPVEVNSVDFNICSGVSSSGLGDNGEAEEIIDDWEGIERTELEKLFGKAVVFVNSNSNADQIGEQKSHLYGLQKVVLEGPCHGSQPMILNVSARAEWNAWQKVGDISREMAMEEYVEILSRAILSWNRMGEETQPFRARCSSSSRGVNSIW